MKGVELMSDIKGHKVYREQITTEHDKDGNIKKYTQVKESFIPREEPDFVKLYLDHVLVHHELSVKLSPILKEVCSRANYANDEKGGMMLFLNSYLKTQMCNKLGYSSVKMLEKALKTLVDSKILVRVGRGTYLLNPHFFGKGHWQDIKKIRAQVNFNTGEFIPNLQFDVRDASGNIIDGVYQNEDGDIINMETGEIIKEGNSMNSPIENCS